MKIVFNPKTQEVVEIDETKEPNWQKVYYHRSGVPFEWATTQEINYNDLTNEKLCELIEEKTGKPVAVAYKTRRQWLLAKVA